MQYSELENPLKCLDFQPLKTITDIRRAIKANPAIDSIRADAKNMLPKVYIALYSSRSERGFGGCSISKNEFQGLKDEFYLEINFTEI